ncbi:hypothetical protein N7519_001968 [Penicillium mononematosum]|uniref:uncharacterized protein n=1 Tax=Penicillium mononematosum TaxID=268346 RepID=UPI0025478A47|nr:uncharacterized protein N7519_001968 [Penicillium mononematosum]KAJ6187060.1 hypothetical protein N7519_001968 [Penicillium mononematosum]
MRLPVPEFQKGAAWPIEFLLNRVIIRTAFFSPDIPCNLEICKHDDILFGRGAAVLHLREEEPKCFLSFSHKVLQDDRSANVHEKRSDGIAIIESVVPEWKKGANWRHGFTGRISIELYKRWHPLASDYEEREDFFGSVVLSIHSEGADPKCFLCLSSGQSSADCEPHSPAPGNGVSRPSMTSDTIAQKSTDSVGTFIGKNQPCSFPDVGPVKRKSSHDSIRSELRRSERLTKRART